MQPSIPLALDVLIALSKDEYSQVSDYCATAVSTYFSTAAKDAKNKTMDSLCENFFTTLTCLPRVLNNVGESKKNIYSCIILSFLCYMGTDSFDIARIAMCIIFKLDTSINTSGQNDKAQRTTNNF